MKTKLLLTALIAISITACERKDTETTVGTDAGKPAEDQVFLITELPAEQLVSTPVPVHIPGVDSRAIRPGEVRTPGVARVIYQQP